MTDLDPEALHQLLAAYMAGDPDAIAQVNDYLHDRYPQAGPIITLAEQHGTNPIEAITLAYDLDPHTAATLVEFHQAKEQP